MQADTAQNEWRKIFLHEESLVEQTGYFLRILCLSAPMLGVIKILFIPAVILLNYLWKLNGVIAAQPIVETILMIVCIIMYGKETAADKTAAVIFPSEPDSNSYENP